MNKKHTLLLTLFFVISLFSFSQSITNYTFSSSSGSFTPLTGSTTLTLTSGNVDDGYYNSIPIGFTFWYMGTSYTSISASTNGWISLGVNLSSSSPVNSLASGGNPRPVIAPLWDDLSVQVESNVSYQTNGTSGSKIFTLEYLNTKWQKTASGNTISFQIRLYESNGKIEFVYKQESGVVASSSASIGICGSGTGNGTYLSLNGTGATPFVNSTSETSNLNSKPANGQTYAFTASATIAPSNLFFTGILSDGMTLNWNDNSSNETGFLIYRSTDGTNYSLVTQTPANTSSSTQSSLTGGTTYYWKIVELNEGGLSTALTGSQATLCIPGAAPTVTSPVNYCQNAPASQLSALGSNLIWGSVAGVLGGTDVFTNSVSLSAASQKKTNFTTLAANVQITTIDYIVTPNKTVSGMILSLFNSSGTIIATSTTNTTLTTGSTAVKVTNLFYYTIMSPGNYSIGLSAGSGTMGYDNPSFPLVESTGSLIITGVSATGYRCFNNIKFNTEGSSIAPTPSTLLSGTTNYLVSQTNAGCLSNQAIITVNVASPAISQIPSGNLIANYPFNGNALDMSGNNNNGLIQSAPSLVSDRFGNSNSAYFYNGSTQFMTTSIIHTNPNDLTVSIWFKTNTTAGGKLIGFGNLQTGSSGVYNRHIYMNNTGQIYFGVYPAAYKTINSTLSYNDNVWHLATASLSSVSGMVLYIDGIQVASDPTTTTTEATTGYWRIGYDNLNGWPSRPNSLFFRGNLDDALIFHRVLSPAEVLTLFTSPDGAGNNSPVCTGTLVNLTASSVAGASYSWTGPNSFSSTSQNPSFAFTALAAGTYTVQVTASGCTSTAYTNVSSTTNAGQWTGAVSTDWATSGNWCTGIVPTSTTNVSIVAGTARMPVISSSVVCNNLIIGASASLTCNSSGTLAISGTLTNNGTMVNDGTVNFNGSAGQQNYSGISTFNNLTISNTNGLLMSGNLAVTNNLTLSAGILNSNNFQLSVGGNFVNNASSTAFNAGTATLVFNGSGAQSLGGSSVTNFYNLTLAGTGTVTLSRTINVASNLSITSGTFDLATFFANRLTSGGTLSIANGATLKIGGTASFPTNYSTINLANSSTVEYSGNNQTVTNLVYGNLKLSSYSAASVKTLPASALVILGNLISEQGLGTSVSYTAAANISIGGNVNIGNSSTFNGANYSITVGANWVNNGTFNGNTGTLTLSGNGATVSGAGNQAFNNLTLSGAGIIFSNASFNLSGNFATSGAGNFSQNSGGTITMTGSGKTISGAGISIDNLSLSGSISTDAAFEITGNLIVGGSLTASSGVITMSGNSKSISGTGTKNFASLSVSGDVSSGSSFSISNELAVSGSFTATAGTATFTGNSTLSGTANLFTISINGTSFTLHALANLGIANTLNLVSGSIDLSSFTPNTITYNGSSAQVISGISNFSNLSISNASGVSAQSNLNVNGILDLKVNNPSASQGSLNLVTAWNNYPAQANETSYTLYMGATATTLGIGDVTGIVTRNTIVANTSYTFGNQFTAFSISTGTMPTSMTVIIKIGATSPGNSTAVQRHYELLTPGGSNCFLSGHFHYLDSELNGNTESMLVTGDSDFNGGNPIPDEHGRASYDFDNNYIGLSNIPISYFTQSWRTIFQLFDYRVSHKNWTGEFSSDWNNSANWFPYGNPSVASFIIIPDAATTNFDPALPSGQTTINTMTIENGAVLQMGSDTLIISNSLSGGWEDQNPTGNDPGTSTVVFAKRGASTSGTAKFYNVSIADTASLTLETGSKMIIENEIKRTGAGTGLWYADIFDGTVEYSGASQNILSTDANPNYHNLILSGSGVKTMPSSNLTIDGSLQLSGAVSVSPTYSILVDDSLIIGNGASFTVGNSNHTVGGDFVNNGTFNAGAGTLTLNGISKQSIRGSNETSFSKLELNNSSGALLSQNCTIDSLLTLSSGTLNINNYNLSFGTQAAAVAGTLNASAMLIVDGGGEVRKYANAAAEASFTFPIGDGYLSSNGAEYSPLTINFSSGTFTGYVSVDVKNEKHPNNANLKNYLNRYWSISTSGITAPVYDLTATYLSNDVIGSDDSISAGSYSGTLPWVKYASANSALNELSTSGLNINAADLTGISTTAPNAAILGGGITSCNSNSHLLSAQYSTDASLTYLWSTSESSSSISVAPIQTSTYVLTITDGNGFSSIDSTTITINQAPTISNAGSNQLVCISGTTLAANTAVIGTGTWSIASGPSNNLNQFSNIHDANSDFTPDGGIGSYELKWTISNPPCDSISSVVFINVQTGSWYGFSSDWFDANNWCGGVPTSATDVQISTSANSMPLITAPGATCHNLTIQAGAELLMNSSGVLTVTGNFANSGTFSAGGGKVIFAGISNASISGNSLFSKLFINSSDTVSLFNDVTLSDTLKIENGILSIESNVTLDMGSNPISGSGGLQVIGTIKTSNSSGFSGNSSATVSPTIATLNLKSSSTIDYSSTANQTISSGNYANLSNTGGGNRTLDNSAPIGISGTFNPGNGNYSVSGSLIIFNGSSIQSIPTLEPDSSYNSLQINNPEGANLVSNSYLIDSLSLVNGPFNTNGYNFTLLSNASHTARISAISGGSIIGNVTLQRFIPGTIAGWATIGMPLTGATLEQWNDDIITSGYWGSNAGTGSFVSVYSYDESAGGNSDNYLSYVAPSSSSDINDPKKGYYVFIGDNATQVADKTIDISGTILTGTQDLNVKYTNNADATEDGWNLVDNPYPSAINWNSSSWTKAHIDNAFYIYNAENAQYAGSVDGVSYNGGSALIASSQAFFVHANAANPILIAQESVKTAENPVLFKTNNSLPNLLRLQLSGNNGSYSDECVLRFLSGANTTFDTDYDAYKLYSFDYTAPNISTQLSGIEYAVNTMDELTSNLVLPVRVNVNTPGNYTLNFSGLQNFTQLPCFTFEDKMTHTFIDLKVDSLYNFYSALDTASLAPRFVLHFGVLTFANFEANSTSLTLPGNATVQFTNSSIGATSYLWDFGDGSSADSLENPSHSYTTAGLFTVTLTVKNGSGCNQSKSLVITVDDVTGIETETAAESFSIRKEAKQIYAYYNFRNKTKANINLYNSAGIKIGNTQEKIIQNNGRFAINLPEIPTGIYFIEVVYNEKKLVKKVSF